MGCSLVIWLSVIGELFIAERQKIGDRRWLKQTKRWLSIKPEPAFVPQRRRLRLGKRVACGPGRAARGREGSYSAERRAGEKTAGVALGSNRQGIPFRDRRRERLARRPLPRALAASRLPLHVRTRLQSRVSVLL